MVRALILLVGVLAAGHAQACSCSDFPIRSEEARAAKNVFVFRLLSSRSHSGSDRWSEYQVSGKIQVLANVRGTTNAQEIEYWIHRCCGIRLEAGKDYLGFLPADTRQFRATAANILPLWDRFGRAEADELEAVLRGQKKLEDAFPYGAHEIMQLRPPPPPCPGERGAHGVRSNNSSKPTPLRGAA